MQHTIQQELQGILTFIATIWVVFLLEYVVPLNLLSFGLTPRTIKGLFGILTMPFLHADLKHIVSNTIPLFVLLALLAGSKARSWEVVIEIVVLAGILLWLFGRPATHIGASGLIFGLIGFLIVAGWFERRLISMLISIAVTFLYGGVLLAGVIPQFGNRVSWEGHLLGAVAGGIVAYQLTRPAAPMP